MSESFEDFLNLLCREGLEVRFFRDIYSLEYVCEVFNNNSIIYRETSQYSFNGLIEIIKQRIFLNKDDKIYMFLNPINKKEN